MKDNNRGLTLIELVVGIALLATILLSIYSFYIVGIKGFARETTRATNQTSIRRASNEIARQVRRGQDISTTDSASLQIVFSDNSQTIYTKNNENKLIASYYKHDSNSPDKETVLSDRVEEFNVLLNLEENEDYSQVTQVSVTITSIKNADGHQEELVTLITLRK